MPQMNWIYNSSSLAEAIDNVLELVDTTEESTILQFQNTTGNMSDIAGSYDNVVRFPNNTKIGYAKNGSNGAIVSKIFENGMSTITGVLVGVNTGFALQKACEAFGLEANWWGGTGGIGDTLGYRVLNNIANRKGCNVDDLLASKVFGITTDGKTVTVGKNFLDDVATALHDEGMTFSITDPTVGEEGTMDTYEVPTQVSYNLNRALNALLANTNLTTFDKTWLAEHRPQIYECISKTITKLSQTGDFAGFVRVHYDFGLGFPPFFYCEVGYLTDELTSWAITRTDNYIAVKYNNQYTSVPSVGYWIRNDNVEPIPTQAGITTILNQYTEFNEGAHAISVYVGTAMSLTRGYAGIDYIGDPLNGSSLEQYPAWLAKLLGLFMPLALSNLPNLQEGVQEGIVEDTEPYADIDPYEDVPPTDGTDEKPDPPDPTPPPSPTPIPPIPSFNANKLYTVHTITDQQLDVLGGYLWSSDFIALIEHMFTEPVSAVLGLQELHYGGNISVSGEEHIKLGAFDSGATGNRVTNRYVEFSCGSVNVAEYYKNVEDYDPYTTIQIFLPYIGYCSLDSKEVMDSVVEVKYGIDVYTGSCVARILVTKAGVTQELYNFYGQCGLQLPVTSADYSRLLASFASVGIGLASGNAPVAVAGGLGIIGGAGKINYGRTNGFNNNVGTMTSQKPFILIQRPVAFNATSYERFYGFPSNWTIKLSMCSGYTRVKDIHLDTVVCTDEERKEIEDLLKTGVIF